MSSNTTIETLSAALMEILRNSGALTPGVEAAFQAVPRHLFLPEVALEEVYSDKAIPLKHDKAGMVLSSSSQPGMMVIMLRQLDLHRGDNVLEIGTATGYNAAIMQHIVGYEGHVTTMELDADLTRNAENNLHRAGASNVRVVHGDGVQGYAPRAAYDRIISTAGVWDIPRAWIQQLKPLGRIVAPIWLDGVQVSATFIPQPDGTLYSEENRPCAFVYMRGEGAVPVIQRPIGNTSLVLLTDEIEKIDTASLHMLLSDDHEKVYLGYPLRPAEYWYGYQLHLMINEPSGYIFAVYAVLGERQVYGLSGMGIALFGPGSAAFLPYEAQGNAHSYAGADAVLAMQQRADEWNATGRPGMDQLRLRLISKSAEKPRVTRGKVYVRREHYLHVWMEDVAP